MGPNGGGELGATVRSEDMGEAETGNPIGTEGFRTGRGCGGGKGNGLSPTGGSVHEGEDVGVALGRREGTNDVNVAMGKTAGKELVWAQEEFVCGGVPLLFGKRHIGGSTG